MFSLRRTALRIFAQSSRQPSYFTSASRSVAVQIPKLVITRALHQSRLCFAEETSKPSIADAESTQELNKDVEESTQELNKDVEEKSILDPEVAEASKEEAKTTIGGIVEQAKDVFASGSQKIRDATVGGGPTSTVYIGNLFFDVTAEDLREVCSKVGEVHSARIVLKDGRSKGFGFVEFSTPEQAKQAIETLDQKILQGRRMAVQPNISSGSRTQFSQPRRPEQPPSSTIYIGNMSYQMSDQDLNDLFRDVRNVVDVRVAIDRRTGQPRGFAHADFSDISSAQRAKEYLESKVIYGRRLRVDYTVQAQYSSDTPRERTE